MTRTRHGRPARRRHALAALLATLALLAAACGGEQEAGTTPGTGEPTGATGGGGGDGGDGELFEMEITVTHYPSLLYAVPYIAGMEQGFFQEEGIRITGFAGSEGGGTTVRNVLSGGLPFGEVATPAAAQAYLAGAPLVVVGGGVQSVAELLWVTTKDSELDSIEDMPGKSVGYTSPGSVTQGTLSLSLANAGVDVAEVDARAMGGIGEGLTALEGGALDAASNLEPIYSRNADAYQVLWWADDYISAFQQTVIITSPQMIEENPDVVEGFVQARARAIEWVNENPDEAARLWSEEADFEVEAAQSALDRVLETEYYGVGFHAEGLAAVDKEMHLIGLVEEGVEIPWSEFVNQDHLPEDVEPIDVESVAGS